MLMNLIIQLVVKEKFVLMALVKLLVLKVIFVLRENVLMEFVR